MSTATAEVVTGFDVKKVRADFPILSRQVHGLPLVYLDNAATTQKPQAVIDTLTKYYTEENANIHRGVHQLSQIATDAHDAARRTVQRFLNAADPAEIIFTRGATESINLVAQTYGRAHVGAGDEVVITAM
jgi:cysteine desulfurase/selenocysteine lyase